MLSFWVDVTRGDELSAWLGCLWFVLLGSSETKEVV